MDQLQWTCGNLSPIRFKLKKPRHFPRFILKSGNPQYGGRIFVNISRPEVTRCKQKNYEAPFFMPVNIRGNFSDRPYRQESKKEDRVLSSFLDTSNPVEKSCNSEMILIAFEGHQSVQWHPPLISRRWLSTWCGATNPDPRAGFQATQGLKCTVLTDNIISPGALPDLVITAFYDLIEKLQHIYINSLDFPPDANSFFHFIIKQSIHQNI